MLDERVCDKKWKFSALHQIRQQQSVFRSEGVGIKQVRLGARPHSSNGKPAGVQISNATIWLQHLILKRYQPQFLCSANQVRTISSQVQLKTIVLRKIVKRGGESRETVRLESAVRVR